MHKAAMFVGFAAICVAITRFLLAPLFLAERIDGAIGLRDWPFHRRHRRYCA